MSRRLFCLCLALLLGACYVHHSIAQGSNNASSSSGAYFASSSSSFLASSSSSSSSLSLPPVNSSLTRQLLLQNLLGNASIYDETLRPFLGQQAVTVMLNYRIDLLYLVSSADEQFSLSFFMTERWIDPRLAFSSSLFPLPYGDSLRLPATGVWRPDTYFYNAVKCVTSDSLLKLDPLGSGLVSWTRHLTCTFYTPFDLSAFPFDSQVFPLQRLSFNYNDSELLYTYSPLGCLQPDPRLDFVNALWALNTYSCVSVPSRNAQPQTLLVVNLFVSRLYQNYVLKNILPLFLLVIVSAMSYFIDPMAAPARVGLSVSVVLTVSTFNLLVSQDLPKINYSTLLDWYVWECFLFVILAVGEFAFVNHLASRKVYRPIVPRLIDDFFQWTIPIVWGLSNLIYWPVVNDAFNGFLGFIIACFLVANSYRIWWCYKHERVGMIAPVFALYTFCQAKLAASEQAAKSSLNSKVRRIKSVMGNQQRLKVTTSRSIGRPAAYQSLSASSAPSSSLTDRSDHELMTIAVSTSPSHSPSPVSSLSQVVDEDNILSATPERALDEASLIAPALSSPSTSSSFSNASASSGFDDSDSDSETEAEARQQLYDDDDEDEDEKEDAA